MKTVYQNVIAIDPDVEKSGVALLVTSTKKLQVVNLAFPKLIDYLKAVSDRTNNISKSVVIVVEAGWLRHSNWHIKDKDTKAVISAKGNSIGRNHEIGRKIVEMCHHYGLEVIEQPPLEKCWKGRNRKITAEELASITGLHGQTNQESRDAALIAWNFAGLPLRIDLTKN